jgi:beta-fructofuranosidase
MKYTKYLIIKLLFIAICLMPLFAKAQRIAKFSFEGQTGENTVLDSVSLVKFSIANHFNFPERINGTSGQALRLDGYSSWAHNSTFKLPALTSKLTISAWFAPECFTKENAAIISQIDNNSGFAVSVNSWGNVTFDFFADSKKYSIQTSRALKRYCWNFVATSIDLNEKRARIWVNGEEWASTNLLGHQSITISQSTLYLGRHTSPANFSNFLLTALNGAIDEVCLYNSVCPDEELNAEYEKHKNKIPALNISPEIRYKNDYLRPRYHAMPNAAWTNEPYGLIWYKGKYHLFFQKNPNGPYLYFMHWGHLASPDLVNWTEEKIALAPSPGFDNFGIWSGALIKGANEQAVIFYTGVDGAKAGIGMATSTEDSLIHWTKNPGNPLIPNPPSGYASMDFRDPFLWKSGDTYYMMVGSGLQNNGGGILFTYKSTNLINWQSIPPLYKSANINASGTFWEMPFFYQLNENTYLLGVTPVPTQSKPAETLYWLGKWENETFQPFNTTPQKLELINNRLLSPAINPDENQQPVYLGIIPEDRDVNAQVKGEWRHIFSLPRSIRLLKDSLIGQVPHPNLCRLRTELVKIENREILPGTKNNLTEIRGNQLELEIKIKASANAKFMLQLFKHETEQEFTSLIFDVGQNRVSLDRRQSALSGMPLDYTGSSYIFNPSDTINLRLFLDHSVLEVFIDQLTVFSCRVYPTLEESQLIDFITQIGKTEIVELNAWKMKNTKDVASAETCPLINLPESFHKLSNNPTNLGKTEIEKPKIHLYPNPASDYLTIDIPENYPKTKQLSVQDICGREIIQYTISQKRLNLNISTLKNGIYFLCMDDGKSTKRQKFIVIH